MPEADTFDAPPGKTFYGALLQSITEAFAGNGIQNDGDGAVTADGGTAMGIDVAAVSSLRYGGTDYDVTAASFALSDGPATTTNGEDDRRVDAVVFDRTRDGGDGGFDVLEGAPSPNPEPPSLSADQYLLSLALVDHGAADIGDDDLLNWRAHAAVDYEVETADIADGAVTTAKVSDTAITTAKIGSGAVTTAKIETGAVDTAELADAAVTTVKIDSGAVDNDALSDGSVTAAEIVDGEVGTAELADAAVTDATVSSSTTISRGKIDDERLTTGPVTSDTTTSGEELVFADTSGGGVTITLATADVSEGNFITVIDVGGSVNANPITIDTEGIESIDGGSSTAIDTQYGASVVASDGSDWYTGGGGSSGGGGGTAVETQDDGQTAASTTEVINFGSKLNATETSSGEVTIDVEGTNTVVTEDDGSTVEPSTDTVDFGQDLIATENGDGSVTVDADAASPDDIVPQEDVFEGDFVGDVADADERVITVDKLSTDEGAEVYKAVLTTEYAQAVASGVGLALVAFDNSGGYTVEESIVEGDGGTVYDRVTGDPIVGLSNTEDTEFTIGVLVENMSGSTATVVASFEGRVGLPGADEVLAQMLSRRHSDISATEIEAEAGVSANKAQALTRRNRG